MRLNELYPGKVFRKLNNFSDISTIVANQRDLYDCSGYKLPFVRFYLDTTVQDVYKMFEEGFYYEETPIQKI
jgi:hypothetical protein